MGGADRTEDRPKVLWGSLSKHVFPAPNNLGSLLHRVLAKIYLKKSTFSRNVISQTLRGLYVLNLRITRRPIKAKHYLHSTYH